MTVKSIKHTKEKRVLIPSREEAGQEAASPKVKAEKGKAEYPVNPVVHRGQDPELFWMHKYGADDREDRLNVDIRSLYRHEHMKSAGVKNGIRNEQAVFTRVDRLNSCYLHAEGFYLGANKGRDASPQASAGETHSPLRQGYAGQAVASANKTDGSENRPHLVEKKAYIHIGPKFGTVSRQAVNEAVKECRTRGDADWLIILGFSFESNIENQNVTTSLGSFEVTKVRMHDDLMQDGLLKRDKKAASFVTIGEPDVAISDFRLPI